ncbi:MAG: hypothetical protein ACLUI3_10655 [Christensenellales bacterium]
MMSMSGTMVVDYFRSEFGVDTDFEALCAEPAGDGACLQRRRAA